MMILMLLLFILPTSAVDAGATEETSDEDQQYGEGFDSQGQKPGGHLLYTKANGLSVNHARSESEIFNKNVASGRA